MAKPTPAEIAARMEPYVAWLKRGRIMWMHGEEGGAAPPSKPHVQLWPYRFETHRGLLKYFTHEVVHKVREPEFEYNEGAVEAVTDFLMRQPRWIILAQDKLGQGFLSAIKDMKRRKKYLIEE